MRQSAQSSLKSPTVQSGYPLQESYGRCLSVAARDGHEGIKADVEQRCKHEPLVYKWAV
jgi:hypothetical protein